MFSTSCVLNSLKTLNANATNECSAGYIITGSSACTLTINNQDNFDWHNVKITLNDVFNNYGTVPVVKAGDTYNITFDHLTKADGTFYNVRTMSVLKLKISSDNGICTFTWPN